jgi:PAS domain S-box-containing protein
VTTRHSPEWLMTTVGAVRELMIKRLETEAAHSEAKRDLEMALEELDVMWEELQGQAALLVRENERYAEFFEFAPDAYLITDAGGRIREANQAALELLSAPRDGIVGRQLGALVPEDERVSFLTRTVGLMIGSAPKTLAWRGHIRPGDGAAQEVEFSVRAIPLKKSGIAGLCWLLRPPRT